MRIGDMIILNGVFCLKRLTCKAGFVRICEVTCSIEDCACSGQAHPYQISNEYWHQKTPARKRSRRTVDNCGTSRCIWQDGTMRKSWNKGKHIGVRVAAYMKQSHGIETARYPRFRLRQFETDLLFTTGSTKRNKRHGLKCMGWSAPSTHIATLCMSCSCFEETSRSLILTCKADSFPANNAAVHLQFWSQTCSHQADHGEPILGIDVGLKLVSDAPKQQPRSFRTICVFEFEMTHLFRHWQQSSQLEMVYFLYMI